MTALVVAGARPQFVKAAALLPAVRDARLVHTGQHADPRMVDAHFRGLGLAPPDVLLDPPPSGDRGARLDAMTDALAEVIAYEDPRVVVALGDADSALAAARAAARAGARLAHVEAGARSGEADLVEERNRIEIDAAARVLLCSTEAHARNLRGRSDVHVTGDLMADLLLRHESAIRARAPSGDYGVLTLHRAATADDPGAVARVLAAAEGAGPSLVFPVHPRTARSLGAVPDSVEIREPMPYLDFLGLVAGARLVLTDSGGLQKEAYLLGVPCITLRQATEWGETVDAGWNVLAGTDPGRIRAALADPPRGPGRPPLYGDGRAAERIARLL